VHRILGGAGFSDVSLTPLDPEIQLADPKGEAEAADFVMAMGPLMRVLPSLSAAERENVRATLEVYFRGHAASQGVVLPAENLGGASARLTLRLSAASPAELPGRALRHTPPD
jgi:hypothetical protein